MEFILRNKHFEALGLGSLKYISNYKILQKEGSLNLYNEALNTMLRTNLKNRMARPIVIITSEYDESVQMFDQEFLLHLQSMAPELIYYGKDVIRQSGLYKEIENANPSDSDDPDSDEYKLCAKNIYKATTLYKCSYDMPRNRYCNIAYKFMENGGVPDLYCQIYYCGPSLYSRVLIKKLTFKLVPFVQFLEFYSQTLHLYYNSRAIVNNRFGRSHYYLCEKEDDFSPENLNLRFLDDNILSID